MCTPIALFILQCFNINPLLFHIVIQEWNGRREITEKTFKFDGKTVPSLIALVVLFPGFIYMVMKDELVRMCVVVWIEGRKRGGPDAVCVSVTCDFILCLSAFSTYTHSHTHTKHTHTLTHTQKKKYEKAGLNTKKDGERDQM